MASLTVTNNSTQNPQTLPLWQYVQANDENLDPASPTYTSRIISHSLLREGGVLALEDQKAKELVFPLIYGPFANASAMAQAIILLNQIITTPGATAAWQDDGMSQATTFDLISSQFDVEYSYRKAQKFYTSGKLRLFAQPLGRTAAPRAYAAASAYGPLMMISPYSNTTFSQIIGASTQAGVAGYGGRPMGASSGIFYAGQPSLAGDAPALLVMTTQAEPGPATPSSTVVSLLPDALYVPTMGQFPGAFAPSYTASSIRGVITQFVNPGSTIGGSFVYEILPFSNQSPVPISWAGNHRVFAVARASGTTGQIYTIRNSLVSNPTVASVQPNTNWQLYDLGTFALQGSRATFDAVLIGAAVPSVSGTGSNASIDIAATYVFPDATTWFCGPSATLAGPTIQIDDFIGKQEAWFGPVSAPSPAFQSNAIPFNQYTRGLVPRPDPQRGLPILAVLSLGGGSWPYPLMTAQVQVIERAKYILP